ncbi:MAG: aminotransferase class I/II-fold pyridoxal phosphate-dependent enzyme [Chloroflexi bacterium]|nr:aminotransferase class I/II-fold pyridoxal phosphate-dependent enzyme [Chloroflexota bacterium]
MHTPKQLARPLAQRVAGLNRPPPPSAEPQPIPTNVIDAALAALDRGETHYTDRPGIPEFRAWVADHLRERYNVSVDPAEVTITCGSTEARYVCLTHLVPPGRAVLCPGDESRIRGALHLVGARIVDSIRDDVSLLYITPDIYRETSMELLQRAEDEDWWIVYDLSFAKATAPFHPAQNPKLASRVVTIDTLSERMAGWRLGWMAGSEMALRLRAGKQAMTICTTAVSQWAGLAWARTTTQ